MMKEIRMSIPDFFTCPISLELFSDPVTLCTGQTYDRPSIERWLAYGNLTCPVTMQKLHDISMVPNHTLRHLIDQWLHKGNTHHDDDHGFYKVGSKIMFYTSLKNVLESQNSASEQKIQALEQILCLSKDLPRKNEGLIQMGFFSLILGIIFESKNTQLENMVLLEKSLKCALKLVPFSSLSYMNMLLEEQNFDRFKNLLHEGSNLVKVALCNIIEMIFLSKEYNLSIKIGNDTKIIQSLLGYISNYPQNTELSEAGAKAILSLLSSSSSSLEKRREYLIQEGLIESMVTYILEAGIKKNKDEGLLLKVIKALQQILDDSESAKRAFMVNGVLSRGIKALIKMVFRVSGDDEGSESAVNCLMILCDKSMIAREEAIYGGILTQLLLLLQSQCSTRTKTRARILLKLLRSMWPKDPKQL